MQTRFIFLVAGDAPELYQQAHGACLSLLAHAPGPSEIVVCTTRPDRFRWLAPAIRLEPLGDEQMRAWRGRHDYFYRTKFEAVRQAASLGAGHLILMDADVLVTRSLAPMIAALDEGACLMHIEEKALSERKGTREALQPFFGRSFAGTDIEAGTLVLNSGVVGIPDSRRDLVDRALACNDAMLDAGVKYFAVEQVAWSAVLRANAPVRFASESILHYWGNKRAFIRFVGQVLAEAAMSGWTPQEAAAQLAARPLDLPLRVKDRWWHQPVKRWLRLPTC